MERRVNYAMIDAFTTVAFKGNPAAVCLLEEGGWNTAAAGDSWMKSVAAEFNISQTCFLTRVPPEGHADAAVVPRFRLRWFTPVEEIDAFTSVAFKGNPAAVCLLEEGGWDTAAAGDSWMKSVAAEFNISETCFLTRVPPEGHADAAVVPRFRLRWFTPVEEVDLCGHATLAAAHFLFKSSLAECNQVEFITRSGVLTAKKICGLGQMNGAKYPDNGDVEQFSIELDFPVVSVVECHSAEVSLLPGTLKGVSVVDVKKTAGGDLLVELDSGKDVANIQPQFDEIRRCAGRGLIVTGPAPDGSGFDIFSRFFCPKLGINEDPVCGSAHCVLAPYWRRKIGKSNLIAYMASPRGGRLDLLLEEETQRVKIRGEAVTVMVGTLLA